MAQRRGDGPLPRAATAGANHRARGPLIRLGRAANDNWPGVAVWLRAALTVCGAGVLAAYLLGLWH